MTETGSNGITMTDDLFLVDHSQLEKEAMTLASKIIADDRADHHFASTLERTGSPTYGEMLVSRASALVGHFAVSESTSPAIACLYGNRLGAFLHRARLARGLWNLRHPKAEEASDGE